MGRISLLLLLSSSFIYCFNGESQLGELGKINLPFGPSRQSIFRCGSIAMTSPDRSRRWESNANQKKKHFLKSIVIAIYIFVMMISVNHDEIGDFSLRMD